jgi:alpha-beta hydrolase superfamily lysophospholipase
MRETTMDLANMGRKFEVTCWSDEEVIKRGNVLILHGMAEHCGRYCDLAAFLGRNGFPTYAYNHRGHGRIKDQGHFADSSGWEKVTSDIDKAVSAIKECDDAPLHLLGHSMGSFLAQWYAIKHGRNLASLILSGSSWQNPWLSLGAWGIANLEALRLGKRGTSELIEFLSFSSFNNEFKPARTSFDWLSNDQDEVDRYIADELCGFPCTNQLWADLMGGLRAIYQNHNRNAIPRELPVFVFGGEHDPVGGSKKLTKLANDFRKRGSQDVRLRIYPGGRHEMFFDQQREDVYNDCLSWLGAHSS